jgi:hypothetical protein
MCGFRKAKRCRSFLEKGVITKLGKTTPVKQVGFTFYAGCGPQSNSNHTCCMWRPPPSVLQLVDLAASACTPQVVILRATCHGDVDAAPRSLPTDALCVREAALCTVQRALDAWRGENSQSRVSGAGAVTEAW